MSGREDVDLCQDFRRAHSIVPMQNPMSIASMVALMCAFPEIRGPNLDPKLRGILL